MNMIITQCASHAASQHDQCQHTTVIGRATAQNQNPRLSYASAKHYHSVHVLVVQEMDQNRHDQVQVESQQTYALIQHGTCVEFECELWARKVCLHVNGMECLLAGHVNIPHLVRIARNILSDSGHWSLSIMMVIY